MALGVPILKHFRVHVKGYFEITAFEIASVDFQKQTKAVCLLLLNC